MPLRETGEKFSHWMRRFMSSKRERKKFPDQKQRAAVAYSEARRGKA